MCCADYSLPQSTKAISLLLCRNNTPILSFEIVPPRRSPKVARTLSVLPGQNRRMGYIIPHRPSCRRSFCTFLVLYVTMLGRLTPLRLCHGWVSKRAASQRRRRTPSIRQEDFRLRQQHYFSVPMTAADRRTKCSLPMSSTSTDAATSPKMINLHTIPVEELEIILKSWGHPKYRAKQVYDWVHVQGVTNVDEMNNIPKTLRQHLKDHSAVGTLQLDTELISKDGTIKRAYRVADGQLIESVLMPYQDGRYTACISSQAGCAQGCVFCATGQMGFSRQLTPDEILEQVSRFASELAAKDKLERKEGESDQTKGGTSKNHGRSTRLSNIVFMGSKSKMMHLTITINISKWIPSLTLCFLVHLSKN